MIFIFSIWLTKIQLMTVFITNDQYVGIKVSIKESVKQTRKSYTTDCQTVIFKINTNMSPFLTNV